MAGGGEDAVQDVPLVLRQTQPLETVRHRAGIELGDLRDEELVVGARQNLHRVEEEGSGGAEAQQGELVEGSLAKLAGGHPGSPRRLREDGLVDLEPVAGDLGPDVRLGPVDEGASQLHLVPSDLRGEGPAADPRARLEKQDAKPAHAQLPRGRHPGEPGSENDRVVVGSRTGTARARLRLQFLLRSERRSSARQPGGGERPDSGAPNELPPRPAPAARLRLLVTHWPGPPGSR